MAKVKSRAQYISKGEHGNMSRQLTKAVRRDRTVIDKWVIKQRAWLDDKNPWLSVENPNTNETNKRFVRVRANDYWGNPHAAYIMGHAKQ